MSKRIILSFVVLIFLTNLNYYLYRTSSKLLHVKTFLVSRITNGKSFDANEVANLLCHLEMFAKGPNWFF